MDVPAVHPSRGTVGTAHGADAVRSNEGLGLESRSIPLFRRPRDLLGSRTTDRRKGIARSCRTAQRRVAARNRALLRRVAARPSRASDRGIGGREIPLRKQDQQSATTYSRRCPRRRAHARLRRAEPRRCGSAGLRCACAQEASLTKPTQPVRARPCRFCGLAYGLPRRYLRGLTIELSGRNAAVGGRDRRAS